MRYLALLSLALLSTVFATGQPECRCLYGEACWPSAEAFNELSTKLSQPLLHPVPAALPCYRDGPSSAACVAVRQTYTDAQWRADQPGAMQTTNFETYIFANNTVSSCPLEAPAGQICGQGPIPPIGVDARTPKDVEEAIRFAKDHNLKLVVKNTGHDFLGRSSGRGAFMIWTHRMKDIMLHDAFKPAGSPDGPGVQGMSLIGRSSSKC